MRRGLRITRGKPAGTAAPSPLGIAGRQTCGILARRTRTDARRIAYLLAIIRKRSFLDFGRTGVVDDTAQLEA
jgi:hypothetical protein